MERLLTTSKRTVADYFSYCREICVWSVENKIHKDKKIGGIGMVVEIDESKFGKRKYSLRLVEGQWVFGGICRETCDGFLVALPGNKQDRANLEPIIIKNIEPGTAIISDCWKAYDNLGSVGFSHLTVNHSYNFVDLTTGAHTKNIENLWWQVKRQLSETHTRRENWDTHLCEYIYHLHHSRSKTDLYEPLLKDAGMHSYQ